MAISRMQQPRQLYGLGSFVKKAVKKVTSPVTKVAKKLVPKEIAGIMRVAAPFLPPGYREAAYLLGTAKQTGRISPIDLALAAAPTFFSKTDMGRGIAQRVGDFTLPGMERNLRDVTLGTPAFSGTTETIQRSPMGGMMKLEGVGARDATSGILGQGGKFFQFGVKDSPKILDTKAGQFLLGGEDGGFSKAKVAGVGLSALSLIQNSKTPEEAGTALAQATGNSDDYDRGYQLFSQLTPELFAVPEQFRAANGGLMRTNYAIGSGDGTEPVNPFGPKPEGPVLPDEDKPFTPKPLKPIKASVDDPFYRGGEEDDHSMRMFGKPYKELNADELEEFREEMMRLMNKFSSKDKEGIMMASSNSYMDYVRAAVELGIKPIRIDEFESLTPIMDVNEILKLTDELNKKSSKATGGKVRANLALGTKPTTEESGLGGLPIEADMRYTGGFMPYGAVEKADDVPARLSKNEFVFTADAVRAAGGGSVNEGAKKMYQAMKQLEKKPEAKGMMA